MNKEEAKKRIQYLSDELNNHNHKYYVLSQPSISDKEYDDLLKELIDLESSFPEFLDINSPSQRVGSKLPSSADTVIHRAKMYSLDNTYSVDELKAWDQRVLKGLNAKICEYTVELKIDGISASLTYENGEFILGATRGDGASGENVTNNLRTVRSIPLKLKKKRSALLPDVLDVRGEVYMTKEDFEKFNRERKKRGEEPFANPRNLAAGSIRQLDPKLAASRPLKFMAYDLVTDLGQTKHSEEHAILRAIGFKTDDTARVCRTPEEVVSYWKATAKTREALPFHIDGIVVQVNDNTVFQELGVAGKGPRAVRALKFAGKQATTKILDIQVQIGRTGAITPVALLEPVRVASLRLSLR